MRVSLPITTVAPPSRARTRPAAFPRRSMKSAETGPSPTRPRMPSVPKYLRFDISLPTSALGHRRRRLAHHQREQRGQAVAHLPAIDDQVDRAVLDEELGALEAFRQRLPHGLLDHA